MQRYYDQFTFHTRANSITIVGKLYQWSMQRSITTAKLTRFSRKLVRGFLEPGVTQRNRDTRSPDVTLYTRLQPTAQLRRTCSVTMTSSSANIWSHKEWVGNKDAGKGEFTTRQMAPHQIDKFAKNTNTISCGMALTWIHYSYVYSCLMLIKKSSQV